MIWDATRFVPSADSHKGGAGVGSFIYRFALGIKNCRVWVSGIWEVMMGIITAESISAPDATAAGSGDSPQYQQGTSGFLLAMESTLRGSAFVGSARPQGENDLSGTDLASKNLFDQIGYSLQGAYLLGIQQAGLLPSALQVSQQGGQRQRLARREALSAEALSASLSTLLGKGQFFNLSA